MGLDSRGRMTTEKPPRPSGELQAGSTVIIRSPKEIETCWSHDDLQKLRARVTKSFRNGSRKHWKSLSNITNLQPEGFGGLEMETLILKMQDKSSCFLSVDKRLLEIIYRAWVG